jgi:sodium-dependent dicarboxylate transporter 2/3/5
LPGKGNENSEKSKRSLPLRKVIGFFAGIAIFTLIMLWPAPSGMSSTAKSIAAIALLMATWWMSEAIPIAATALIPLVFFPLLKISPYSEVSLNYANHNIFLFMGGFFIAAAMQKWKLHRRIALHIIRFIGTKPARLILGFMVATAFISMWISNTATTMMMLPIALAVILGLCSNGDSSDISILEPGESNFAVALMLGIAYAASVGGTATLIGTPPNIIFVGMFKNLFPNSPEISFLQWMTFALPFAVFLIILIWLYLTKFALPLKQELSSKKANIIEEEIRKLGKMNKGERLTLILFTITAILWIFRVDIRFGSFKIPGWCSVLGLENYVHDSTVAIAMSLIMFFVPVNWRKNEFLLDWSWAIKIPWGILILFGGGFALAAGFVSTGLAPWIGDKLYILGKFPPLVILLILNLVLIFLTEVMSNTAVATTFLPIIATCALAIHIHPYLLMISATLASSMAFMLPAATPPNAIVFGSGFLTIPKMAKVGLAINLIATLLLSLYFYFLFPHILGIEIYAIPVWAK